MTDPPRFAFAADGLEFPWNGTGVSTFILNHHWFGFYVSNCSHETLLKMSLSSPSDGVVGSSLDSDPFANGLDTSQSSSSVMDQVSTYLRF